MGNHDRSRPPRWAGLLLMASAAMGQSTQAASGLTLSNFQLITSTGVPLACILTYNTVLPSCQTSDFTSGNTCSTACVNGIRTVQRAVLTACDQVSAPGNSVLGQALAGNLVELLCPSSGTPPLTTSSKKTITIASTATTSSTVSTTLSKVTLTPVASSTATPSRTETLATDIPTYSPPPAPSGPPGPQPPAPPATTGGQQQSTSPAEPTAEVVLGGGSPFDVVTTGASSHLAGNPVLACLVGLALSLLLAR